MRPASAMRLFRSPALRWLRPFVPEKALGQLERALLQMLVALAIEALLAGKQNYLVDEAATGGAARDQRIDERRVPGRAREHEQRAARHALARVNVAIRGEPRLNRAELAPCRRCRLPCPWPWPPPRCRLARVR